MNTKIIFALLMTMGIIGSAQASEPKKEEVTKVYFYSGKANLKKISIYKARGFDPYLYSGRFPWARLI
tara:strand:+ start:268 stop:471 length:204 start_codon:yes stop_codon:yes gene_type:complete